MSIKSQLCEAIKYVKDQEGLTYDKLVERCGGVIVKSQLTSILKYDGLNVSVDTLEDVLRGLGRSVELHTYIPFEEEHLEG